MKISHTSICFCAEEVVVILDQKNLVQVKAIEVFLQLDLCIAPLAIISLNFLAQSIYMYKSFV
jgi:hypothetical protein